MTPQQRRRWDQAVIQRANEMLNAREPQPPAAQIAKDLTAEFSEEVATPTERTVQDWIRKGTIERRSTDGPWRFDMETNPDNARLVLETMGAVNGLVADMPIRVTIAQSGWIVRLRRSVPDCGDVTWIWTLAVDCVRGEVDAVHASLLLRPWADNGERLGIEANKVPKGERLHRQGLFGVWGQWLDHRVFAAAATGVLLDERTMKDGEWDQK